MGDIVDTEVSQQAIEDRVRDWVVAMLGIETIFAHPDAPRPPLPYCMINIINASHRRLLGPVYFADVPDEGEGEGDDQRVVETRAQEWEWTASIHLYGPAAMDSARRLINSLSVGTVLVDHIHPLHVAERSLVRRVPEQVNTAWESRAVQRSDESLAEIVAGDASAPRARSPASADALAQSPRALAPA